MCVCVKLLSRVQLFVTPWTVAHQAPLSMGFSRQEYYSGLPFPFSGDLPNPGIEPRSPTLQADALSSEPPGKPINKILKYVNENACVCANFLQSCPTLCDPMDLAHRALLSVGFARILEWVAGSSEPWDRTCVSYVSCTGRWVLYH